MAKIIISVFIWALSAVTGMSCDFNIADEFPSETESFIPDYDETPEIGVSCYLEISESSAFSDYSENACDESDGSWEIEGPEGFFSQDHPDEQSMTALYSWRIPEAACQIVPNTLSISAYTEPVGAIYPPPQYRFLSC